MFRTIVDKNGIQALQSLKYGLIDGKAHFSRDWLVSHAWIVVPIESSGHFNERDAQLLSRAFALADIRNIFAIATESLFEDQSYFQVSSDTKSLIEFSDKCGLFNFVLLPQNRSVAVLCTAYDYYLVAGNRRFVATAVGGDIDVAWTDFRLAANDPVFDGWLKRIVERYEPFSSIIA